MIVLVGLRTLKSKSTAYITCDGYYTGVSVFKEPKVENIPVAILAMYMQPVLIHPKSLGKCKELKLIDIDCRELLVYVAHTTNIAVTKNNKLSIAESFAANLPYFERETINLESTPFERVYKRFSLQNCLAAEENPYK